LCLPESESESYLRATGRLAPPAESPCPLCFILGAGGAFLINGGGHARDILGGYAPTKLLLLSLCRRCRRFRFRKSAVFEETRCTAVGRVESGYIDHGITGWRSSTRLQERLDNAFQVSLGRRFYKRQPVPRPPNPATISRPFLILFSRDADCSARSSHSRSHNLCVPATLGGTRFLACFCFTRFCFFFAMFFVFGRS